MNNKHKPTILQVLPSLVSGGVERGTVDISRALMTNGFRSLVASSGGPLVSLIENAGATHITLPLKSKNPWHIFRNINRLADIIKKEKVDIVHARSRAPAWSAYFAAKKAGCRFVTTFHGAYGMQNFIKRFYNSVMLRGEKVIVVSEFIKKYIQKHYPDLNSDITVIHRGVDTELFNPKKVNFERLQQLTKQLGVPDGKTIITMPARITRWKGHLILLQALAELNKKHFYCLIVGDIGKHYNYYNEILELMGKLGLDNNVTFSKPIKDMPALYMISDIIVAPSLEPEAFGRIPIEAQAMAKIIIATNMGGFKETIIDQKNGFLIPSNDSAALVKAIKKVMDLPVKRRQEIGNNARKFIEHNFTLNVMTQKTLELYKKLL
jgi:glycosyltransferase involved in cell wall biosynthesis